VKPRRRNERGSAAVELALVTPVLIALMLFVVGLGRLAGANGEVQAASRDAARAAANARSPRAAQEGGLSAAAATLQDRGVECRALSVAIDADEFRADGFVSATVSCTVDLGDLTTIGFPASKTLTSRFTAPVDRYRGVDS
jgi:Flp pilus assembly protein TadG